MIPVQMPAHRITLQFTGRSIRHMRITWSPLGDTWTAFPTAASAYYLAFW